MLKILKNKIFQNVNIFWFDRAEIKKKLGKLKKISKIFRISWR